MDKQEFGATVSLVGTIGLFTALIPSIEKLWDTKPDDDDIRSNILSATMLYSVVAMILVGTAYSVGYKKAALLSGSILAAAIYYHHYAFLRRPIKEKTLPDISKIEPQTRRSKDQYATPRSEGSNNG